MYYEGLAGMPRRYLDYSNWISFDRFGGLNRMMSIVAIVVFAVQLMFLFNFFYSISKGQAGKDPKPLAGQHAGMDYSYPAGTWQLARRYPRGSPLAV